MSPALRAAFEAAIRDADRSWVQAGKALRELGPEVLKEYDAQAVRILAIQSEERTMVVRELRTRAECHRRQALKEPHARVLILACATALDRGADVFEAHDSDGRTT